MPVGSESEVRKPESLPWGFEAEEVGVGGVRVLWQEGN